MDINYQDTTQPTQAEVEAIEKMHPDCTWIEVEQAGNKMHFAFKPFSQTIYYASMDIFRNTNSIGNRNMTMATGHLINGKNAYLSNDKVRIAIDLYAQSLLDDVQVSFKKKPTFTT